MALVSRRTCLSLDIFGIDQRRALFLNCFGSVLWSRDANDLPVFMNQFLLTSSCGMLLTGYSFLVRYSHFHFIHHNSAQSQSKTVTQIVQ